MSALEVSLFILIFGAIGTCIAAGTGVAFYLGNRMTAVEVKIEMWTDSLGSKALGWLHSPHTPELDALIEKYQKSQMNS